jgi:hypothetical protein
VETIFDEYLRSPFRAHDGEETGVDPAEDGTEDGGNEVIASAA